MLGGRHRCRDEGWRALPHNPPRCAGGCRSPTSHPNQLDRSVCRRYPLFPARRILKDAVIAMCCFRATLTHPALLLFAFSFLIRIVNVVSLEFVIQNVTYFHKTPWYHNYLYLLRSYIRHRSTMYI